ncbi:aldehyde dehydrogenase (NADP(+)) [Paraburkholderia unamae]|uniref:NADP-dependent aldehyde dehydrogenase n=1 Tax=Paraburkholderia unamae TaxID=219649 RepID=A0ABX5KPI0_9BURK|nr:aldehyde dehydrogenase (NADP(+)) [Paraburkholderia unamae]PVX84393.1 NADP-dependent aldehyde dehydrogenase [Paraburkholderia unamae]
MQIQDHSAAHIHATVTAAAAIADDWAQSSAHTRAALLRALANALDTQRDALVRIADEETSLGGARLNGEIDRTRFQLNGFADYVEAGHAFALTDDPAIAQAPPAGRPHLSRVRIPLGPVAMFSASNFPFAFSVLGGDTASALAAGCPVVVKAHPGHPRLSRSVFELARAVIAGQGLPAAIIGMVEGAGVEPGIELVNHPDIAAVAFTGSFKGGAALWRLANARARPIPFYGELGSINPVVALPSALETQARVLAQTLAASIEFGCAQVCTSPGLVVLLEGAPAQRFEDTLRDELREKPTHRMLTPAMKRNFDEGVARLLGTPGVQTILAGSDDHDATAAPRPVLARTSAKQFVATPALHEEIFGPACLIVRAGSIDDIVEVLGAVGGSLTVTLWGADEDTPDVRRVTRRATQIAGRVLFSGVPTGVAVTRSQQHGGPWPASTQPFTTSVGYEALERFLRPVALQSAPAWLGAREGQPC